MAVRLYPYLRYSHIIFVLILYKKLPALKGKASPLKILQKKSIASNWLEEDSSNYKVKFLALK